MPPLLLQCSSSFIITALIGTRKNIAEARAELEGAVRMQVAGEFYASGPNSSSPTLASSANSYKMKLERRKAAQRQQPTKVGTAATIIPAAMQPPANEIISAPVPSVKVNTPTLQPNAAMSSSPPPSGATLGMSVPTTAASTGPFVSATAPPSVVSDDEENVRRSIRTLQGLLLKHRGGPGFGAGRLRAPDAQRLEDTLHNVKSILRAEVVGGSPTVGMPEMSSSPVPTTTSQTQSRPVATQPIPALSATTISPPVSAVTPSMTNHPLAGSVACVEAVLKMYKESTPAEREAMIVPLREAFMAAASASNKYIAESELSAHRAAMEAGPVAAFASIEDNPPESSIMGFPTSYAVTNPQDGVDAEEAMFVAPTGGETTDDEKKLEDVYNALLRARGDGGKLGLKNISGDEANDLADKLVMMRGVLLDELNK